MKFTPTATQQTSYTAEWVGRFNNGLSYYSTFFLEKGLVNQDQQC